MTLISKGLILEQIESLQNEILLLNFIFSLINSLSLFFLGIVLAKLNLLETSTDETYIKFLQAAGALFVPYLTIISQGFYYPRWRKLNSLRHLLFKSEPFSDDEAKLMYDKQ